MLPVADHDPHDGHTVTHYYGRHTISDNDHDDYEWAHSYAEAIARHFDKPAPILLAHAAGLDIHAGALDQRAQRLRALAEVFRGIAKSERAEFDRRTT